MEGNSVVVSVLGNPSIEGMEDSKGGGLSKEEKGRYKKLRKRLHNVATHQHVSGFILVDDCREWDELVRRSSLDSPPVAAPQFLWRRGSVKDRWTEGSHHRDVLFSLLLPSLTTNEARTATTSGELSQTSTQQASSVMASGAGKKRARQEPSPKDAMSKFKAIPSWLSFHNPASVASVVVVELHCSAQDQMQSMLNKVKEHLASADRSFLATPTRWFSGGHQVKCISDALLFASPKPDKQKQSKSTKIDSLAQLVDKMRTFVLSSDELLKANYPVGKENDDDWVSSPKTINSEATSPKLFALDCEMVETTVGRALARFTLVEAVGFDASQQKLTTQVVLDTLVQPQHRVTDYLTQYSGITPDLLEQGPTMTLSKVQEYIITHVTGHDVLVGHSLENDLQVCLWVHDCCVDTALLFSHTNTSFKYSLRHLSRVLLKRDIQDPYHPHCSEEDAKAAIDLAVGRALKGDDFVLKDTRSSNQWRMLIQSESGNAAVAVGPNSWLQKYITSHPNAAHALSCDKCTDPNSKALFSFVTSGTKRRSRLAWAQFHVDNQEDEDACTSILQQVLDGVSVSDTVVLVAFQCLYEHVRKEQQRRRVLRDKSTTLDWTDADELALVDCMGKSRLGHTVWVGGTKLTSKD
ncbi:hypothetical protein ACA910_016671 [Epithemia clementina (nom. ined.)]